MPNEEKMTLNERRKYLRVQQKRYYTANRKERSQLLDEMVCATGLHRKALIQLIHSDLKRKMRGKQRRRVYGSDVEDALRIISESYDGICAERLADHAFIILVESHHRRAQAPAFCSGDGGGLAAFHEQPPRCWWSPDQFR
jgi:hypothetical protein